MLLTYLLATVFLSAAMGLAWVIQWRTRNAGWVDTVWSLALGLAGVGVALLPGLPSPAPRQVVVAILVGLWGLRLGGHIADRTRGKPEDARYAALRTAWGAAFQPRMAGFLQIQAAAAAFLALSMLLAAHDPAPFPRVQDALGIAVLAIAIGGEALADAQLRRFRRDPANHGGVCDRGLWGWSRHPNYFFEWLGWLAYPLLAIDPGWLWGWLALSGPVCMYWLLVYVSGIPLLEQQMLASRGERFRRYQARVSAFFPLPPRRSRP
jgi:steroid 5-alpha reductase family enzyme